MPSGSRPTTPANICRIAVNGNIGGAPFTNVYHVKTDDPGITTSAGVLDMITAFKNALNTAAVIQKFSNATHVTSFQGVVQTGPDSAVEATLAATIDGAASGTGLMASDCLVASWLSSAYWRGGKPRTYLPGLLASQVSDVKSLNDTFKASVLGALNSLLTGVNAITTPAVDQTTFGFVSYASGKEWRSTPLFVPFTGVIVHDRIGTQRRRLGPWLQ